ncbi:MAG: 16S rRNA (adenine(1518)-N(6)/adenine(1519)-N(6))-dimethyltransferase RsmA [Pelolinea sp.]|nr:16S rRNA (adenine(1518)-N(6)/adenine(1519)-N(6))-dimethyltransferase RsmA [Pelolinea sp.]
MFKPLAIASLMSDYGIKPKKGLGQNFLIDENYLAKITEIAGVDKHTDILEIGAGIGNLTRHLADAGRQVTAVELDKQLIPILKKITREFDNVHIVEGDILEIPVSELVTSSGYVVAANIPYYITSVLIRYLLENDPKPRAIVLTIQREVAQRVCAKAGDLSLLALSVQVYGSPKIAARIPAGAFYPAPKVDSAVLVIDLYDQPLIAADLHDTFFMLAKAAFSQKRKMMHNALAGALGLNKEEVDELLSSVDIDPQRRAQTISIEEWDRLIKAYQAFLVRNK